MSDTAADAGSAPEPLDAVQARILGALVEKEATTPESYPLTANAVQLACNQKNNRDPVLELEAGEIGHALRAMEQRGLVRSVHGARAQRYEHRFAQAYSVTLKQQALLSVLMLRGPQTAGELRIASERMHNFADISSVEGFLDELAERPAGALVVKLPRLPGARESRWAHLLSGEPLIEDMPASAGASGADVSLGEMAALRANVARLEAELGDLKALVNRIAADLGMATGR